jgi:hypothetical protein
MSGKYVARAVYLPSCFKYEFVDSGKKIPDTPSTMALASKSEQLNHGVCTAVYRSVAAVNGSTLFIWFAWGYSKYALHLVSLRILEVRTSFGLLGITHRTHFIWFAWDYSKVLRLYWIHCH